MAWFRRRTAETPASPAGFVLLDIDRMDGHAGDQSGRALQVEIARDAALSTALATVLEPFLQAAPRGTWVCRGEFGEAWLDFAEVVTYGPLERLGARLLREDAALETLLGESQDTLRIACRRL